MSEFLLLPDCMAMDFERASAWFMRGAPESAIETGEDAEATSARSAEPGREGISRRAPTSIGLKGGGTARGL